MYKLCTLGNVHKIVNNNSANICATSLTLVAMATDTSSPARSKRHGSNMQKKGTFHMVKNQEDSSTFVIKEGQSESVSQSVVCGRRERGRGHACIHSEELES